MSAAKASKTARERVLETAEELFYREGIRAVGVDTIVARSGVAKMSLYRNFSSKDDLIVAYLQVRSERFWRWWDSVTTPLEGSPLAQIRGIFESLLARVNTEGFRGCPFVNTAAEFPTPGHPAREAALTHHRELRVRFTQIAKALGVLQPEALADQLIIVMDGIYSSAGIFVTPEKTKVLLNSVDILIQAQLCDKKSSEPGPNSKKGKNRNP